MAEEPKFNDGQAYERLMGRWSQRVGRVFIDWLSLPKGQRWLDVGCGNGAFTEVLIAQSAPSVTGVDPSEGQLAYARSRPGTQLAQFRAARAQALPFEANSFDVAVMPLVITFVPDPAVAVREMVRVVASGGTVAAYMWDLLGGGLPRAPLYKALGAIGVKASPSSIAEASRESDMRSIWEQAGLRNVETRVIRIQVDFSSFDDFWASNAAPVGPADSALRALSPQQLEQLKAETRTQLPIAADGTIAYEAFANAVKGQVAA
jgi:SAM-dependent methyltransferase